METTDLTENLIDKKEIQINIPFSHIVSMSQSLVHKEEEIIQNPHLEIETNIKFNYASRMIYEKLLAFGFQRKSIEALLLTNEFYSIDYTLLLLEKSNIGWLHNFVIASSQDNNCQICGEQFINHASKDLKNIKIQEWHKLHQKMLLRPKFYEKSQSDQIKGISPMDSEISNALLNQDSKIENISKTVCEICYSSIEEIQNFSLNCNHNFCLSCIKNYLESKIEKGNLFLNECPLLGCHEIFTEEIIFRIISSEYIEKYKKFKKTIEVNMNKNARWCPKPDCENFIISQLGTYFYKCKCGYKFCFKCGNIDHPLLTCEKAADEKHRETERGTLHQKCPNCNILVFKRKNFNLMRCTFCHYEFCWICGFTADKGHYNNPFLGCPGLKTTNSDWDFCCIFLFLLATLIFWPFFCLFLAVMGCRFCLCFLQLCPDNGSKILNDCAKIIAVLVLLPFLFYLMIIFVVGFFAQFIKLLYLIYRCNALY